MTHEELLALLTRSRIVFERHLFEADGETIRDDIAEVCIAIDDALSPERRVQAGQKHYCAELERNFRNAESPPRVSRLRQRSPACGVRA